MLYPIELRLHDLRHGSGAALSWHFVQMRFRFGKEERLGASFSADKGFF
jgi:hypothetical protein